MHRRCTIPPPPHRAPSQSSPEIVIAWTCRRKRGQIWPGLATARPLLAQAMATSPAVAQGHLGLDERRFGQAGTRTGQIPPGLRRSALGQVLQSHREKRKRRGSMR